MKEGGLHRRFFLDILESKATVSHLSSVSICLQSLLLHHSLLSGKGLPQIIVLVLADKILAPILLIHVEPDFHSFVVDLGNFLYF